MMMRDGDDAAAEKRTTTTKTTIKTEGDGYSGPGLIGRDDTAVPEWVKHKFAGYTPRTFGVGEYARELAAADMGPDGGLNVSQAAATFAALASANSASLMTEQLGKARFILFSPSVGYVKGSAYNLWGALWHHLTGGGPSAKQQSYRQMALGSMANPPLPLKATTEKQKEAYKAAYKAYVKDGCPDKLAADLEKCEQHRDDATPELAEDAKESVEACGYATDDDFKTSTVFRSIAWGVHDVVLPFAHALFVLACALLLRKRVLQLQLQGRGGALATASTSTVGGWVGLAVGYVGAALCLRVFSVEGSWWYDPDLAVLALVLISGACYPLGTDTALLSGAMLTMAFRALVPPDDNPYSMPLGAAAVVAMWAWAVFGGLRLTRLDKIPGVPFTMMHVS